MISVIIQRLIEAIPDTTVYEKYPDRVLQMLGILIQMLGILIQILGILIQMLVMMDLLRLMTNKLYVCVAKNSC